MEEKKRITSFRDLEVYRNTYEAMLIVMKEIVLKLPANERDDLTDQLSRACKAIPRLIAEGYAKRHQRAGFQKYIDDAMAECNEMVVSLSQARDIYPVYAAVKLCDDLIDIYDKSGRQLYKLGNAWTNFKTRKPLPNTETGFVTVTENRVGEGRRL
ncbi:MAG: four helix bundle protein [bacterium]